MAIPGSVRELTVADAMIANPKTLGVDVGLADAQQLSPTTTSACSC